MAKPLKAGTETGSLVKVMNICIDCERPVQFENDRCPRCWREHDAEVEQAVYPDEEFNLDSYNAGEAR